MSERTRALVYRAAPGERNDVRITLSDVSPSGGRDAWHFEVEDSGPLVPGRGCARLRADLVRCDAGLSSKAIVALGDRDDRAAVAGNYLSATFRGGPGDDRLLGGEGADRFNEGARANGSDVLRGGSDSYGGDLVDYSGRRRVVRADIDGSRDDGERGEGDLLGTDVESLAGGRGGDRLGGDRDDNLLVGGPGADRLVGGGGEDWLYADAPGLSDGLYPPALKVPGTSATSADRLFGGPGMDTLVGNAGDNVLAGGPDADYIDAGAGRDRVRARDGAVDFAACGHGRDAAGNDPIDFLDSCERSGALSDATVVPIGLDTGDSVIGETWLEVLVGCRTRSECTGTMWVELGGRRLSPETSFTIAGRDITTVETDTFEPVPFEARRRDDFVVVIESPGGGAPITRRVTPVPLLQTARSFR